MNSTIYFKNIINDYLTNRANTDELFAEKFQKENKNIDDCIDYIITTVKYSGVIGFTDDEIYSMAIHYYEEDNLKIEKNIRCNVVVNKHIESTKNEEKSANLFTSSSENSKHKITEKNKVNNSNNIQPTLF